MSRRTLILLKILTWILCLIPWAHLVYQTVTNTLGPDSTHTLSTVTGHWALRLLVISLLITPIRKLIPQLGWLIRFRRLLGLFAFFYAFQHLMIYLSLYTYFNWHATIADILKRRYVTAGIAAWFIMLLLALTSTSWAIRKMGGKRWNQLHKLVYVAVILGVIHYWWIVKPGVLSPIPVTVVTALVLLARPTLNWWQSRRTQSNSQSNS